MPYFPLISPQSRPRDIAIGNSREPAEAPVLLPFVFDFTAAAIQTVDLTQTFQAGVLSNVQSMYFDNSKNDKPVVITIQGSQQIITLPIGSQGYLPVLVPQPGILQFDGTGTSTGTAVYIALLNVPMPLGVWSPYDTHTHG